MRRQLVEPDRVQADVGIGLMTIFNMIALYPLSGEAMDALNDYEKRKKLQ